MDYRELENRMQRNRDLIKERQYERVIEEAKKANRSQRANWFAGLKVWFAAKMSWNKPRQSEECTTVPIHTRTRFENH